MEKITDKRYLPEIIYQKAKELLIENSDTEILELILELSVQNEEKAKRVDELISANNKVLRFVEEIKAQQIEVKTQNEELHKSTSNAMIVVEKYSELFNFAPIGYVILSAFGEIIDINLKGVKILGKEKFRLKGARFGFFVSDDTKPDFNRFLENVFNCQAESSTCEVILSVFDRSYEYVHLTGIIQNNGEQCLVTITDLTDYRLQQEKLKQSEQRFQALVEWSPYAALVHREMKIIYVNPAAVKLFGATSEQDLIGTPVLRWHHPDYHQIVLERIRKANVEGVAAPMIESKYFKLDGSIMDLEVQGKPIIYDGLPSILATFNDVTERRRVEHQLSERLKEIETLFFLSKLSEMQDLSLNALCQELTDYLPNGFQYPEIACSRIVIDEVEFRSENFEDSAFLLSAPVKANSISNGRIEVAYLKEMPKADEGSFLKEERVLINALAQQLGTIIDRKNSAKRSLSGA